MSEWDLVLERASEASGRSVLVVSGEVDLSVADRLAAELGELLAAGDAVVDLSAVGFIDSSGVRELLRANQRAADVGSALALRAPSPACRRVLEISGVWSEFAVEDDPSLR